MGMIIVPTGLVGGGSPWANWDWSDETALVNGTDGENIFVSIMEGDAAADEIGKVGSNVSLSGANLVLSQNGAIPAATGGYRQLTAASTQFFSFTTAWWDELIKNQAQYTIAIKVGDWTTVASLQNCLFDARAGVEYLSLKTDAAGSGRYGPQLNAAQALTSDAINTATNYVFAVWRGSDGDMLSGFTTNMNPTKKSDFAGTKLIDGTNDAVFIGSSPSYLGCQEGNANYVTAKIYGIVVAKTSLIDNAA